MILNSNMGAVALGVGRANIIVPSLGRSTPGMSAAQLAAMRANQGLCNQAADAVARNSPAAPQLLKACAALRRSNVLAGKYYTDAMTPNDPAYRVDLTDAGEAVIARFPALAQARAQLPLGERRGFTIAQGVRKGSVDPAFVAWVTPGLAVDPQLLKGFTDALSGGGTTQATQPPEPGVLDRIPKPVLIGGAVAAAIAVGLVAYKVTR